jgi:hypothetical protein
MVKHKNIGFLIKPSKTLCFSVTNSLRLN